jgi:ABC-2 type transport system ATP-binding protein
LAAVDVTHVYKSFGETRAVQDVTFSANPGEIFGLLGPNGAGKTTLLRMILDIYKPEQGQIAVLGGPIDESRKNRIGYLPEERGLYQDLSLERVLVYLAALKGVPHEVARQRLGEYLEMFDLSAYRKKKIKEMSKGMQQKAQLIATLLHQPDLVIVDEPFSALDPVNTQMVKNLLVELHRRGVAIVMSTHQMQQVEELCERIVLINSGRVMLYGDLAEIRRQYMGHAVLVRTIGQLPELTGVIGQRRHNATIRLELDEQVSPRQVLGELVARGAEVEHFEVATPTLEEIFVQVVKS